jgi:protoheme ferro-lyase
MKGVLLVNLGSPESPTAKDVKPYLDDIADILNKNDFQMIIWDRIINEVADDDDIFRIVEKIQNDLDQN